MNEGTVISRQRYSDLMAARISRPQALIDALRHRERRPLVRVEGANADGNLMLLAADHTARGMLAVGSDPLAVADRYTLLDRLATGLANPHVDGILASADILEELSWLGLLEGRLAIGTMNRGGIIASTWELDDRLTAYDSAHVASMGLDGGKSLLRIHATDPGTAGQLELVGRITTELADLGIMHLIEPLPYYTDDTGRNRLDPSQERLTQAVAIASGLGSSSAFTWLKIPPPVDPAQVAGATSCPILMLGGDAGSHWQDLFNSWDHALRAAPNIRGLVPGRALLYPDALSVEDAVDQAARLVHRNADTTEGDSR